MFTSGYLQNNEPRIGFTCYQCPFYLACSRRSDTVAHEREILSSEKKKRQETCERGERTPFLIEINLRDFDLP